MLFLWPKLCYQAIHGSWLFLIIAAWVLIKQRRKPCLRFPKNSLLQYVISIVIAQVALILVLNTGLIITFDYVPITNHALVQSIDTQQHLLTHAGLFPWSLYLLFTLVYLWRHDRSSNQKISLETYLQQSAFKKLLDAFPNAMTIVAITACIALMLALFGIQGDIWLGLALNNPAYQSLYLCTPFVFAILFTLMSSKKMERRLVHRLSAYIGSLGFIFLCYVLVFAALTALLFKGIALLGGPLMTPLDRPTPNHFQRDTLAHTLTVFCWALQLAWAPFVGSIFARLSRGRSLWTVTASLLLLPLTLTLVIQCMPYNLSTPLLSLWQSFELHQQSTLKMISVVLSLSCVVYALTPIHTSKHLIQGWFQDSAVPKRPLQYQRLLKIVLVSTVSCMALLSLGGVFALTYVMFLVALPNLIVLSLKLYDNM